MNELPFTRQYKNKEEVLETLIELTCPLPCVGYINETGWHQGCIDRANKALEIIWIYN